MTTYSLKWIWMMLGLWCLLESCKSTSYIWTTPFEDLKIIQVSNQAYLHVSYLPTKSFGKVACNGLIFIDQGEAAVFDTPTNPDVSKALIQAIETELNAKVKAVVVNHFHEDCLGGLSVFHQQGIPSYANYRTIQLAQKDSVEVPQNGFDLVQTIQIGDQIVVNKYLGEAHATDNIVSYIPSESVLFGGCQVKSLGAGKGYLGDANPDEWSNTARKVKEAFSEAKIVVPGHGKVGGLELLDFTEELFEGE